MLVAAYLDIFEDAMSTDLARVCPPDLRFIPRAVMPMVMKSTFRIHSKQHEAFIGLQVATLMTLGVVKPFDGERILQPDING